MTIEEDNNQYETTNFDGATVTVSKQSRVVPDWSCPVCDGDTIRSASFKEVRCDNCSSLMLHDGEIVPMPEETFGRECYEKRYAEHNRKVKRALEWKQKQLDQGVEKPKVREAWEKGLFDDE